MSLEDVVKRRLKKQQEEGQRDLVEKLNARVEELEKNPSKQEEQKSGLQIFQGGGFSGFDIGAKFRDGYQIGDVAKTGLDLAKAAGKTYAATVGDVWTSAARGLGGVAEGIGDALTYVTAGIMDATDGTDKKGAADRLRKATQKNVVGDLLTVDAIDKNSLLGSTSKAILEGVGQGVATQSAAGLGGPLLSGAMMFASGLGNNMTEAYQGGATDGEAAIYGLATGAWDAITETLSGGLGKGAKALGVSIGIGGIDDMIASGLTKNIKSKVIANLIQGGVKAVGEGLEELLSYGGQVVAKKLTYLSEKDWAELWNNQEALENFVVGMMSSAIMQAPDVVKASQTGRDFVTGRTDAEQTVIDKVYKDRVAEQEKGGKKLTTKEKGQILDAVEQAYERGEIAVEDIEAALGGETYRKYTEATKQQEAMQAEFDKLNGMKKSDMTGAQEDRLQELRQQLETMKTEDAVGKLQVQYLQEAWAKVGSGKLAESYNQREQRRQAFQADLESYDAKQRAIVQKAIDSGILNNTRKSHEFVDLVAKIGAETGTDFDFTNSKKLRESGFALEGVTVNGFTDGKTVTVNINSAKALNTVVGHEIMHVLEGTELAGKLQEQLFAYAKTKGEFDKRRADLETLYAGRDADIDRELAADLVGDYLFTDIDFVRNLKAGDRNLFQRVFDEIKHLVKLATAGSKEARELEKVKKLFEDVYREAGRPGVETVTDKQNAKGLDTEQEVDFSLSRDAEFSDNAIAKNNTTKAVDPKVMEAAKTVRSKIADRMMEIKEKGLVGLPEDIEGDTFLSNSSYGGSMENTTVCPRSLAAEAFMNAVSEAVGRPLTVPEQIYVSQDLMNRMGSSEELRSNMLALECVYCYVAMDRKAQREYLGKYLEQRDAVVEQLKKNPEISTAGLQKDHRALAEHFKNKKSQMPQLSEIGKLYNEYLNGRKPTKNTYKRFKMWVDAYKNGARMVSGSDLANMERLMKDIGQEFGEDLRPQIEDALDYAQKASWAKKRTNYVAYDGKILRMSLDRINKLNSHYGLRMYSFSDFHPAFVLENMQMITDASVRGLKMLGYTKELDFVKIFAPSGMNINISTFGFNSGGNVYENNIMGANWQEAQELRKQYPNVGITYIATDDTQVRWAMEQDWIDVVIPFHMVKTGAEVAEHYGFTNYTKESADQKTKDWKKGNQASIAPTQHNNDLETYLKALAENNLQPRFERFMTNEDGTPNPNYMKLVNECRQSAAESKPVQPIFNEEAAMEAMAKLEANGYYTPIGGSVDRMYEIAADVAEDLATDTGKKRQFSLSPEADRAYMDAVENANMDAAQVMVDEAAKQAGFTEEVYHGTRRGFGFTKYDPSKSNAAPALFTSGDLAVARTYSQDDGVTNISLAQELGLTAGNYRFFANTEGMIEIDAKGGVWDAIRLDQELQDKLNSGAGSNPYDRINNVTSTNELAKYAKQSGYRVVKITNVFDQSLQPGQEYQQEKPGSVYIFLYPNEQLRSADPVTYDDEGNVIPLSQRFNPQSGDFRESLSGAGETAGFDDSQIYGRDVALEAPVQKAPVAAQPENKATGMEAPTAAEMPKAQTVEAPVAEEKPVQTAQEEAKAAPAMEAPTAAEMPGEKPMEAPAQEDALQSKLAEIDMQYEAERDKKQKLYEEKRDRLMEKTQSKDNFFKETALRLYEEIKGLKKGVKASKELRPLLDQRESTGMSWEDLRSALLMVERKPDGQWNPSFEPEAVVRSQIERLYKNATDELAELADRHDREMKALENAAQKRKEALQASQAVKAAERPAEKPAESILTENFRAEAPKEGMQPVVSPVVKGFDNRPKSKKPKREQMTQEEAQYYEQTGETPVTSFRELMEGKIVRLKEDIKRNWDEKRKVAEEIDKEIQKLQLEYDGLKNKTTKRAQWLLHRIDERKRAKADRMAEANKRYHELSRQIQRTEERLRNDTGRADWLERKLEEIDSRYEAELEQMKDRHEEERSRMMEGLQVTKQDYFRETAVRLYDELTKLKKGVAASPELSFVLDEAKNLGFSWREVKAMLLSINRQPNGTVDKYSELETVSREYFDRLYQNYTEELESIIAKQDEELQKLQEDAEEEKQTLRASQVKKDVMEQFEAEAGMLVGYTGGWKDFNTGYGYNTQTMRRFMREVVRDGEGNPNIERADAITDYLQETYSKNHAALNLEAKKRKDKIRELGLNQHESVYTQMLGELRHNPRHDENLEFEASEYLKEFQDKIDLQKVENAVEVFRAEYEDLFVLINNTFRAMGMKEMPYHKGYFPHFEDRTQTWMQKLLNWKPDADQIPTTIAGKTEGFKPVRSWQRFSQKRKGERTDYDAIKGYDTYLDGALDWIYHTADIQRMRSFENYLRYIHSDESTQKRIDAVKDAQMDIVQAQNEIDLIMQESKNRMNNLVVELQRRANLLAGKKYTLDREMEYDQGRPSYSRLTNITGRTSANQVAGNLASAVTNAIPIIQSWAQVSPVRSIEAAKQIIEAIKKDDGIVEKSTFLTNRLRQNESLIQKTWDKIGKVLTFPMELMDSFASQVVWRSMYIDNIQKGMPEAKAIAEADRFAAAVIADRSKGTMPTIFAAKNPIYKAMTTFQLEPANQMGYFFKDLPTEIRKKAEAEKAENGGGKPVKTTKQAAAGVASVLVGSYVYNLVMEALTGNTPATDPIRMLENIIRNIWSEAEDDDEEEPIQEAVGVAGDAILELVKELPYIGGIMGGGRISSTAALPYGSLPEMLKELPADFKSGNYKEILKEMLNLVYYGVLPMGGGQIKKINEGIGMYLDPSEEFPFLPKIAETPGSYTTSGNLRFAVEPTFWNVLQSILFGQYANANAREYFDEGRSPLSPNQVEEFSSVDMSMSEYWDYQDALKAAGDKTADKMEVVMGLDLPMEQKNIMANNIVDRKDPIDLTGAEDFGSFAEFDFYSQNPEKYKFLNDHGISWKEYTGLSAEEKDAVDKLFNAPKKTEFLLKKGITAAQWKDMDEEAREELNFEYNNPEKYSFLQKNGISVADYSGFDEATKDAWDTMAKNPKKYDFLKKQGVTVDQYKLFNQGWKDAWSWAYNNQDAYLVSQGVTKDLYAYRRYVDKINGISGDKRKSDVWKYIQGLDLSDGAKMLLFKQEYPKDDTYDTEIVRYVQSLGMTYAEKKRILEKLGFKIDANGKITK